MKPDDAYELLRNSHASGRLAQAYLVAASPRAVGLPLAARVLSLLFCSADERPCGTCSGCRRIADRTHPDVLWVEPQKRSRIISIDQVREVERRIYQTSFEGGWKAAVFVGADRIGSAGSNFAAANAFLKTLEEPPPRSIFFLLTDSPQFLLPTIVSRCQRIAISGGADELPEEWRGRMLDLLCERVPRGTAVAFGRAERLAALLRDMKKAAEAEVVDEAATEDAEEVSETLQARANARYRELRTALMRGLLLWYRDVMLCLCGAGDEMLRYGDRAAYTKAVAGALNYRQAKRNLAVVEEMNTQLERNMAENHVLSFGFSRLV